MDLTYSPIGAAIEALDRGDKDEAIRCLRIELRGLLENRYWSEHPPEGGGYPASKKEIMRCDAFLRRQMGVVV